MADRTGTVRELWRWPVRGMMGEQMPSVRVDGRGVGGDRTHAVVRATGDGWEPLTARSAGPLAAWKAAYPFNIGANVDPASPPFTLVVSPRQRTFVWNDPLLRSALEKDLGHAIRMTRDVHGQQVVERSILVSWGDMDPAEMRSNLHLDADLDPEWRAGVLTFDGGVRMRLLRPCKRGGLYARALTNGRIGADASVHISGF